MIGPRFLLLGLACAALLAMPLCVQAQASPGTTTMSQGSEHRVALVIGNAAYRGSPLKNPVNDARAMRTKLKSLGFEVVYFENLQTRQVGAALREFRNLIRPGSVALFFYAGHGLQVRGENYLPTVDAELASEEDVPNQSLSVSGVLNTMEDSKAAVNLVLLDACRNNPYARSFRSAPRGLARVQAPSGTLIHYATRPGSVAEDGGGKHGTYTDALLAQIDEKGVPIETALKRVTIRVRDVTKGKQEPWMEGSLTGDFYFTVQGNAQVNVQQAPATADAAAWQAADSFSTAAAYEAYLAEFPAGLYAAAARIKLAILRSPTTPALPAPSATATVPAATSTPPASAGLLAPVPAGVKDADTFVWRDVQSKGGREHYEAYLQQFPRGKYVAGARAALKALGAPVAAAEPAREPTRPADEPRPAPATDRDALRTAALREFSLARLTGADFQMGAEADELGEGDQPDEPAQPRHGVKVAGFELATYEVTVAQFRKFVDATGYLTEAEGAAQPGCHVALKGGRWMLQPAAQWRAPGYAQTDAHPVVCVSWNDVQAYLKWLNGPDDRFRLPSEAEWEFAARAGTTTPRPWSDTAGFFSRTWNTVKPWSADRSSRACKYANVADETLREQLEWPKAFDCKDSYPFAVPGAYFGHNNFGLYDMMGNAAEWTQDCWNPSHAGASADGRPRGGDCTRHVVRGGSWASTQASIRSAARQSQPASYRAADLGFRIARSPKE